MSDIDSRNPTCQIDMLLSFIIIKILPISSDGKEWLFVIGFIEREHMMLMKFDNFLSRDASIRLGLERREPSIVGRS